MNPAETAEIKKALSRAVEMETGLLRDYMILAEKLDARGLPDLKGRLRELAEGNAKRSRQLEDELTKLGLA